MPWTSFPQKPVIDQFNENKLALEWNFLRTPNENWYQLQNNRLALKLRPQSIEKLENPSLIARRIQHHIFEASTKLNFSSETENEKAGLIIYRSSTNNFQLLKEKNEVVLIKTLKGERSEIARASCTNDDLVLKAVANHREIQFYFGSSEESLQAIGDKQDMYVVSFEAAGGFNGPFAGMYATSSGQQSNNSAEFDWFEYKGK